VGDDYENHRACLPVAKKKGNRVTNLRIKIHCFYPGVDCENKFPAAFHGAG
jgi:hypothetical protein